MWVILKKCCIFLVFFSAKNMFRCVILIYNLRETAHFKNKYYVVQASSDP